MLFRSLRSLVRSGDGLDARFDMGLTKHLVIDAQARESDGGAIAGALGLPANQAFGLIAKADGVKSQGQFHLRASSGAQTPAVADGTWSPQGGSARIALTLAASTLSASYATQIGPRLDIAVRGRGAGGSLLSMGVALQAENMTASAGGLVDRDRLTAPKGLHIEAMVRDLARISKVPQMGGASFKGTLAGGLSDWRLAGAATINKVGAYGYSLARIDGPVSLDRVKGELRLQAKMTGQGGAGQGLAAALAGAHPQASLQASRLPDGRILLRSLSADGAGLSLTATGERNLFGGLNLKGALRLSNLAAAQSGASGQIDAHWSASQARATTPWSLVLDAQGQTLATGYDEADHLLGSKPSLHVQADYGGGVISVTKNNARA